VTISRNRKRTICRFLIFKLSIDRLLPASSLNQISIRVIARCVYRAYSRLAPSKKLDPPVRFAKKRKCATSSNRSSIAQCTCSTLSDRCRCYRSLINDAREITLDLLEREIATLQFGGNFVPVRRLDGCALKYIGNYDNCGPEGNQRHCLGIHVSSLDA